MPYITSQQFYAEIDKKMFSPVYVFAGEDSYDHDEALKALEKALAVDSLNREIFFGNESKIEEMIIAVQTLPFMGDKRLVILKNAQKLKAGDSEKISEFLKAPVASTCFVIMWTDKVGRDAKSRALFNIAEENGSIVEFKRIYDNELPQWIQRKVAQHGKKIHSEASLLLAQESGSNLLDLNNEIEKLILFVGKKTEITDEDVELVSGHTKTANLNRLAEVLESKSLESALKITEELLREGEEPIKILFRIYWIVRRFLLAKSLLEEEKAGAPEIRQALRLHNYFDRNFFQNLKKFSLNSLENSIGLILQADLEIKTSARPAKLIFDELIFVLCGKAAY
ncbi:MAG: DNA polymerase III subunit delta [Elusimicrobia bacterium]|nr:DNA polymerase III subunit delta [Elusimicrobiota bacterium]